MTPEQFVQHLVTQPWALAYISNLLAANNNVSGSTYNYISNAFAWSKTPEGTDFWHTICNTNCYNSDDIFTFDEVITLLPTYFPNHPELFI